MAKTGEIEYARAIGEAGRTHAFNKPFSDPNCWMYLQDIGGILAFLPAPPAKLLDLGAGTGWTSIFFAKRGYEVISQDIAADMVEMARANAERNGVGTLRLICCDYEEMEFNGEFDCAVFYDSLHHAVDEEKALRSVFKALKQGGVCVTLEPGEGHASYPDSQNQVRLYGVTEKDMPPSLIIRTGKRVGFREFCVYRRPVKPSPVPSYLDVRFGWKAAKKTIKHFLRLDVELGDIVVMVK